MISSGNALPFCEICRIRPVQYRGAWCDLCRDGHDKSGILIVICALAAVVGVFVGIGFLILKFGACKF